MEGKHTPMPPPLSPTTLQVRNAFTTLITLRTSGTRLHPRRILTHAARRGKKITTPFVNVYNIATSQMGTNGKPLRPADNPYSKTNEGFQPSAGVTLG